MTTPAPRKKARRKGPARRSRPASGRTRLFAFLALIAVAVSIPAGLAIERYTISLQWPVRIRLQWPLVISARTPGEDAALAEFDQHGHRLSAYQQYACRKFGPACRVALAIQRAENAAGACEVYHYNSDGTLDWGYFQINTVHLERPGLNLRDLLDCRANIDFAYQLYLERGFQPWSTYNSGAYKRYLRSGR